MRHANVPGTCLVLLCLLAVSAWADNRALIIGIGSAYPPGKQIVGPAQDVVLAERLARQLGFQTMTVLAEDKATKHNILEGLQWLNTGVQAGEKVFVYYSGHGTQFMQAGTCTTALVPVDVVDTGSRTFLTTEEFNRLLQPLRERATVLLMLDACFSAAMTKSLAPQDSQFSKYYVVKGNLQCGQAANEPPFLHGMHRKSATAHDRLVAFTATAENEVAYGDVSRSGQGSLFTQATMDLLTVALSQHQRLTFNAWRDATAARIREVSRAYRLLPHTPQLLGNQALFAQDLWFSIPHPAPDKTGSLDETQDTMALVEQLLRSSKFHVAFTAPDTPIPLGHAIAFTVKSSKAGYLNLVEIEPNGQVQVVFPNQLKTQNYIQARTAIRIPSDIGGFDFKAIPPVGKSRVVALVTPTPLDISASSATAAETSKAAQILSIFRQLTADNFAALKGSIMRSIGVVPPSVTGTTEETGEFGAAEVFIEVVTKP